MTELKLLFTDIRFLLFLANILYLAIQNRLQSIPSFRDLFRCIPAALINFSIYYIAPTLARLSGSWLYRVWSGDPPDWSTSLLAPVETFRYYRDETTFLDYWHGVGLTIFMTIGFKLSHTLVEGGENLLVNLVRERRLSFFKKQEPEKNALASSPASSVVAPGSAASGAREDDADDSSEASISSNASPAAAPVSASAAGSKPKAK